MSSIELTVSQQQAVDTLDRTVSVSAGAGSGKTEVLVQRFCSIVATQGADVDEILTVTFTEKAAKEMKQRIVAEFARLADETTDPRFEEARRKVESAYIGTIHSFAARLLRENAFEAGVDPRFRVLDSVEASTLRDSVLETLITDSYSEGTRECSDLLSAFGKDALKSAITGLHSHIQSLGREVDGVEVAAGEAVDVAEEIDAYVRIMDDLMVMLDDGAVDGKFAETLARARPTYESIRSSALRLKEGVLTGHANAAYAREFDWDLFEEVGPAPKLILLNVGNADIKDTHTRPAKEHAERFIAGLLSPLGEHYIGCLKEITKAFREQYTSAKRSIGALDFDDLLIRTRDLLTARGGQSGVADEYRRKFKYVIMDEFQDTNSLQKSIIDAVCPPDRFFSVGDVKQSIFGFQNADVNVFMDHHRRIRESEEAVDISFAENFRSRPEILGFVNWLFGQIWQEDGDFDFERLEAKSRFHDAEQPSVELLFVPLEGNTEQSRLAEARSIAARIRQMLARDGGRTLQVTRMKNDGDQPRDLQPGDIMILFRSTTDIPIYERALSDAGIEYYVVSGRGFYETHEVNDLLCLLKAVDNPLDDVAMAAVLRSPLVGVSDDTLWWLTRKPGTDGAQANRQIGRLFDGMHDLDGLAGIDGSDRTKLESFVSLLQELRGISAGSRITDLLDLTMSKTSYDLKALASEHGKQRYANIRKMLDLAQGFQSNNLFHLPDFIRHIEDLKIVADREGEAPTETEESPVVRLMTVHKAKGLQAPVVFVADCTRGLKAGGGPFIFSKDLGAACKIRNIATDDCVATPAYSRVSDQLKQKDIAEEKRLLYVAATRAEELLVLTGISKYDGKKAGKGIYSEIGSWAGWLEKALGIVERPPGGQTTLSADGISVALLDGTGLADIKSEAQTRIPITERLSWIKQIGRPDGQGAHPAVKRCYEPLEQGEDAPLVLTVSRILDYLACPRMYYCRWMLGIRDEEIEPEDYLREDTGRVAPTSLGTAVHQIMRAVDFARDLEPQFETLIGLQPEAVQAEAWEACRRFLRLPWADRIRKASRRLQEVPLRVRLDSCDFRGRADLLFEEDGRWVVADFKTGSGTDKERYRLQVGIYALAVQRCLGATPAEVAVVSLGRGSGYSEAIDAALLDQAESTVREVAQNLRAEAFAPRTSRECTHCDFGAYCDSAERAEE